MTPPHAAIGLLLIAMALGIASEAPAQYPVPRVRERSEAVDTAFRLFEEGRWPEAFEAFDLAARDASGPLPAEALRRWGVAASETGRPLAAFVRLGQYLASKPRGADREAAVERIARAREALLVEAARFSRLVATVERRREQDSVLERHLVRVAARDGDVSLEGMSGLGVENPQWRRAEEIPAPPYLHLLRRLLEMPVLIDDLPATPVEVSGAVPPGAVLVRLVVGEEERRLEAVQGDVYERVKEVADRVFEFARAVPRLPDFEAKAAPAPVKPGEEAPVTPGTLYVIATPIGNLEDLTLRALRVLKEVDLVACEDTRRTRGLLSHFGVHVPVTSYFEHNKLSKGDAILRALLDGKSVGLVTDAGTPGISDPGFLLVRAAREAGVDVVPVPGPSAVIAALSAAGVPADRFVFDGFLPVKPGRRVHRLEALQALETTVVCYESPHRILASLEAIGQVFGDAEIVVAREMTKQFEEIVRGTAARLCERFTSGPVRGEFTIVIPAARERTRTE